MLKFNTTARLRDRLHLSYEQVLKDFPRMPRTLKTSLMAAVFLCCLSPQSLFSQCSPDVTPPTASCVGPYFISLDGTGQASVNPNDIDNGSNDNCGAVTLAVSPSLLTCGNLGSNLITLTVTDLAGNTNTCFTLINVDDNLPPVVTCPANVTVSCGASTAPAATGTATAVDNCGGILVPTYMDTPIGSGMGCTGISRTWSSTYPSNPNPFALTGSCVQTITIFDNVAPVIDWNGASAGLGSGPGNTSVGCMAGPPPALTFPNPPSITVTDNCDPTPTSTVTDVSTKSADPNTCEYSQYTVTRTYKAEDDCGNMSTHVQTITVNNDSPVITPPATINLPAGASCQTNVPSGIATATASDCTPNVNLILAFAVYNNVNGQLVNSGNGLNAGGNYLPGNYTIIYSAIDPCGATGTGSTAMNIIDNVAPTAICVAGTIQVSIPPTGTTSLTAAQVNNGSFDNCTPASGLTFSLTGATFTCAQVGGIFPDIITMTVTDANGNSNSCTSSVAVVNNSPPAVFCQDIVRSLSSGPAFGGTVTVNASELDAGSFDACDDPAPLAFSFVEINGETTMPPLNTNLPSSSYTFNCLQVGVNTVVVRVREFDNNPGPLFDYTNDGFCTQTITIQDVTPPVATCNDLTIDLGNDGMVSVFDAAPVPPTTYNSTTSPVIPDNDPAGVNSVINVMPVGTVADVNVSINITHPWVGDLTATLTSPAGTTITLFDRAGTSSCSGDDLAVTFDDQASATHTTFQATCGNLPAISGTFRALVPLSAFKGENFKGDWTLNVADVDALPNAVSTIDSWSLELTNSLVDLLAAGSTDNCDVYWSVTPNMMDCSNIDNNPNVPGNQPLPYTLTVIDPAGLTASTSACSITIEDNVAPVITCADVTISVGANGMGEVNVLPTDFISGGLYLSSGNNGSGAMGTTDFKITVPNLITFSFDWNYTSNNGSPVGDAFGYFIGGTFTQLSNDNGILAQSGSATVTVTAGQMFGFRMNTLDNLGDNAEVWITNFTPTFNDDFAPANWSLMNTNADGKQFFHDACGIAPASCTPSMTTSEWLINGLPCEEYNCDSIATGPFVVTIEATDVNGNTATCSSTLTIVDEQPPQAQCKPVVISLNGSGMATVPAEDFDLSSFDACCNMLAFEASKDNGVTFSNPLTFNCNDVSATPIPIILKVTDCAPSANTAFCQTTISVNDFLPPAIICPANITVNCLSSGDPTDPNVTGLATATDNCVNNTVTVWYTDNAVPANNPHCQVVTRTWRASDATPPNGNPPTNGNISVCFQTITVQDLIAPSLDWNGASGGLGTAPATPIVADACNVPAAATALGVDNCASPTPVYTQVDSRFIGNVNQFNTGQCGFYNYTLTRTWTVTDNCSNSSSHTQIVNVSDAAAPTYSFPAMFMFNNNPGVCAGTATINLLDYIADCAPDANLTVTYQIGMGPVQTGTTINTLLNVGTHSVTVTATDPCSNMSSATPFNIVIKDNESPIAKCKLGPQPITLNSNGQATITAADVNNNSTDNCSVASLNVSPAFFDCFTTPNPHTVTLTVTDAAGNFNTCTTTFLINNVSAPTISCPGAATVSCSVFDENNPATSGGSATANTACGPITPTYADVVVTPMGINNNCRTITRTWTASTAGGTATCTQTIQIQDNVPPSLIGVPTDLFAEACNVPAPPVVTATDNCSAPSVTYGQTSTQNADQSLCSHYDYVLTRTWSTTDGCNSPVSMVRTVTVSDNTAPALTVPNPLIVPTDIGKCEANLNINLLNYISDCALDQYLLVTNTAISGNGANLISGIYALGDYSVTVTAEDPCGNFSSQTFTLSVRDLEAPQAACLSAVTLILDSSGNGSLTPGDIDDGSIDNCGAVNLSISPSTYNTSNVGVVNVVLTVTDNATPPNSSQCTTPVTVIERGTVSADMVNGAMGTTVSIPVSVTGFDNICALSFSMHLVGTAGNVMGVSGFNLPGMTAGDFSIVGDDIAFSWVSGAPVSVADGTTIFNVDVFLSGIVGSSSNLVIDGSPLSVTMARCDLSTVPVTPIDGSVTVVLTPSNVTLSGTIQTENGGNVQLVDVAMAGSVNSSQTTGAPGTYSFSVPSGSNETITPSKDINDCNGINVLDVLTLQQHILGNPAGQLPTPYRRIAADVNNDGFINVLDRLELHLIVISPTGCPGLSNNTSWRFVDASYVFPDPLNPFAPPYPQNIPYTNVMTSQVGDFVGVKIGDLTLDANPANFNGGGNSDGGEGKMLFSIDDYAVSAGNEYRIDFKAKDFEDYKAYQYTLEFNQEVLQFKQVEMGALPQMNVQNFGLEKVGEGIITSIWYNEEAITLSDDEVLFTLVFDAIADANKLSSLLDVISAPVTSEAYASDLKKKDIGIVFNGLTGVEDVLENKFALYQNRPNPFGTETIIPFYLSQSTHTTLTISDVSGRTVKVLQGDFSSGSHSFTINREDLPSSGVFFYRLESEYGMATMKMVLLD